MLPARDSCFTVFSQRAGARVDAAEWTRHAETFLGTRLTLDEGEEGARKVLLAPLRESGGPPVASGSRLCWSRARTEDDLQAAQSAEGGAGLADLAQRCPQVWLIEASGGDDLLSLRLAAILAGVMLGPILSPGGAALFGPKTARQRLGL